MKRSLEKQIDGNDKSLDTYPGFTHKVFEILSEHIEK